MIDWMQIKQLEEDMGAEDLGEVIDIFLAEVEDAIDAFVADPPGAPSDMAAQLHFLKGCAFNLGFQSFGDYCADGERAAHDGQMNTDANKLSSMFQESKREFLRDFHHHSSARLEVA